MAAAALAAAHPCLYPFSALPTVEARCNGSWDAVRALLGGKGAGLFRMTNLRLPVPGGFTITTEVCTYFMKNNDFPAELWPQIVAAIHDLERDSGTVFGDSTKPLLLSCRSGAKVSMPGMMDTVLNIGLHDGNIASFAKLTNDRFVADSYRRLIQGFGSIVLGLGDEDFEQELKQLKTEKGYQSDLDLTTADFQKLQASFKKLIADKSGESFPQDPWVQLRMSIRAVLHSWNGKRAVDYRNKMAIPHDLGTAVNVQRMVFGNMGFRSATGVAFTRNPSTGAKEIFGDYLTNAQGEDVVSGIRNCSPVGSLGKEFPTCATELNHICQVLEGSFQNMQDIEFTIQDGVLFMLQCRDGKRTPKAQAVIAVDMVREGLISKEQAVQRLSAQDVNALLLPQLDPKAITKARNEGACIARGVAASPGGAVGRVCFDPNTAEALKRAGHDVILVRPFTKPDDVHGFFASKGVLTAEGGATSHAAVVARQFGLPCVVGANKLVVDVKGRQIIVQDRDNLVIREGDILSLNATDGEVYLGALPSVGACFEEQPELQTVLEWADAICASSRSKRGTTQEQMPGLQVWANCDNAIEAKRARAFGARGVGLCRTEHMFFEPERLPIVQEMILSKTDEARQSALRRLLPFQRHDFEGIFTAMSGLPVIIRLLDPPLHEFLPDYKALLREVEELVIAVAAAAAAAAAADEKSVSKSNQPELKQRLEEKRAILAKVEAMHENNPMMGLRGCRVSLTTPAIIDMQVRAIFEAAINATRQGQVAMPYVMVPLISHVNELKQIRQQVEKQASLVFTEQGMQIPFKVGTMIETPRATLTAGAIAQVAEFFSFGTNDLTQMTFGISRDDAERAFLLDYVAKKILPSNPFQTLDEDGVGKLVQMATTDGRATRPAMSIGICGEVGGDTATIKLCHKYGLNYVSCSTFRVPIARLGAACAALADR